LNELSIKEDIVEILRTRRLSYFGHVARMNPNRYPHILTASWSHQWRET